MEETAAAVQEESKPKKKRRSPPFFRLVRFLLIVFVLWWFNNFTIKITKQEITSPKVENDIKITVISDYHASTEPFSLKNEYVMKKIRKTDPDIVCFLGDMHSTGASETEKEKSLSLMTDAVKEGWKVFFVLGEHDDRTNSYISKMQECGIDVLNDEKRTLNLGETKINIYGISNAYFAPSFDLRNKFDIDKKQYNILLAHIPMYSDYEKFGADLTLCGDTHGGVMQLPLLGPAYCNDRFFPEITSSDDEQIYDKGLFDYDGGKLFITSGLGNFIDSRNLPVRFLNRPEVASITISPE